MEGKNYWKILGIEKDANCVQIKRAYAGLVKQFHPEDDPEGFTRIRAAYETALTELERTASGSHSAADSREEALEEEPSFDFVKPQEWDEAELAQKIAIVIQRMQDIYEIIEFRRDRNNWEICFHLQTYRAIVNTEQFETAFLTFLDTHRNFPSHMWRYFHTETRLLHLLAKMADRYSGLREHVSGCVFGVEERYSCTFDYLHSSTPPEILERYIEKTLALQLLFTEKNHAEVIRVFQEAVELIDNDFDLQKIAASYFAENGIQEPPRKTK